MRERYRCTADAPWRPEHGLPVEHDGAHEVGDQEDGHPGGDIVRMRCPNCGVEWKSELPQ